jgi:hypothetical protein
MPYLKTEAFTSYNGNKVILQLNGHDHIKKYPDPTDPKIISLSPFPDHTQPSLLSPPLSNSFKKTRETKEDRAKKWQKRTAN